MEVESKMVELVQAVKSVVKEEKVGKRKRTFAGFKAKLLINLEGLNFSVNVRYGKLKSEGLYAPIIAKVGDKVVQYRKIGEKSRYGYVDEEGNEYPKEEVRFFQEINGKMIEVAPFKRTKEF